MIFEIIMVVCEEKIFGVVEVDIYVFDYLCKIFFEMLFIFCNL